MAQKGLGKNDNKIIAEGGGITQDGQSLTWKQANARAEQSTLTIEDIKSKLQKICEQIAAVKPETKNQTQIWNETDKELKVLQKAIKNLENNELTKKFLEFINSLLEEIKTIKSKQKTKQDKISARDNLIAGAKGFSNGDLTKTSKDESDSSTDSDKDKEEKAEKNDHFEATQLTDSDASVLNTMYGKKTGDFLRKIFRDIKLPENTESLTAKEWGEYLGKIQERIQEFSSYQEELGKLGIEEQLKSIEFATKMLSGKNGKKAEEQEKTKQIETIKSAIEQIRNSTLKTQQNKVEESQPVVLGDLASERVGHEIYSGGLTSLRLTEEGEEVAKILRKLQERKTGKKYKLTNEDKQLLTKAKFYDSQEKWIFYDIPEQDIKRDLMKAKIPLISDYNDIIKMQSKNDHAVSKALIALLNGEDLTRKQRKILKKAKFYSNKGEWVYYTLGEQNIREQLIKNGIENKQIIPNEAEKAYIPETKKKEKKEKPVKEKSKKAPADSDGLSKNGESGFDKLISLLKNKFGKKSQKTSDSLDGDGFDIDLASFNTSFDWQNITDKNSLADALGVNHRQVGDDIFGEFTDIQQAAETRNNSLPNPSIPLYQQGYGNPFLYEVQQREMQNETARKTAQTVEQVSTNGVTIGNSWGYDANGNPTYFGRRQGDREQSQSTNDANAGKIDPMYPGYTGTDGQPVTNGNDGVPVAPDQQNGESSILDGLAPIITPSGAQQTDQSQNVDATQQVIREGEGVVSQQNGQAQGQGQHQPQGQGAQSTQNGETPHDIRKLSDILPIVQVEGAENLTMDLDSLENNLVGIAGASPLGGQEYATQVKDGLFANASAQYDSYCDPEGKKTGWVDKTISALSGIDRVESLKPEFYERFAGTMANCVTFLIENINNGRELNQYDYVTIAHLKIMNGSGSQKFMKAFKAELESRRIDLSVLDQVIQQQELNDQARAVEAAQGMIGGVVQEKIEQNGQSQQTEAETQEQTAVQNENKNMDPNEEYAPKVLQKIFAEVISEPKIQGKPATEKAKGNKEREFQNAEDAYSAFIEAATENAKVVELAKKAEQERAEGKEVTLTEKQTKVIAQHWSTLADVRRYLEDPLNRNAFIAKVLSNEFIQDASKNVTEFERVAHDQIRAIVGGIVVGQELEVSEGTKNVDLVTEDGDLIDIAKDFGKTEQETKAELGKFHQEYQTMINNKNAKSSAAHK